MANPELGTKQICPNCQAKFYDLGRRPAHCPKCAHEFDPDEAVRFHAEMTAATEKLAAAEERWLALQDEFAAVVGESS